MKQFFYRFTNDGIVELWAVVIWLVDKIKVKYVNIRPHIEQIELI